MLFNSGYIKIETRIMYAIFPFIKWFDHVDDEYVHYDYDVDVLRFAKIRNEEQALWVPILEKAFLKVKGNYYNGEGGLPQNALRFLTGSPTYQYDTWQHDL